MTIGKEGDIEAFKTLSQLRDLISEKLSIDKNSLELSMGMSADYEKAIEFGSTNIRVGSLIFGQRNYAKE